jgi:hypothetical protein
MKKCSYCGRENTDEGLHCKECGTQFEREVVDSESSNKDIHDEVKTVTIRTFTSHDAANIARSNLEAHGIECWVNADDCGGWYTNLTAPGGVRLSVRASDAEAAMALLNAEISNPRDSEANVPSDVTPENKNSLVPIGIVVGVVVLLCLLYASTDKNKVGKTTRYHYAKDGKADEEWIYHNGYLVENLRDRNLDGAWDDWAYYDDRVQLTRVERDNNFDGKVDETWKYSNGFPVTLEKDDDFNGIPDEFCTFKNDILQQIDIRPNGSKFTTTREIFKNGVLTEILRGGDSNGNFKEDVRYDPFFNPISTNVPTVLQ